MLGLLGLVGALFASLSLDTQSSAAEDGHEAEDDASDAEREAWGVSSTFIDLAQPADPGGTDQDGLPTSDDLPDAVDPDQTLIGRTAEDTLLGKSGQDQISAGAGDDYLDGQGGSDSLWGGEGQDHLQAGAGADMLAGGDGDDSLWGDDGDDDLTGGTGNDLMAGAEGADNVAGDDGDDSISGGGGDDVLGGGAGNDIVSGSEGQDVVSGGTGADEVDGGAGNDTLFGSEAPDGAVDFLNGGDGDDFLSLGAGDYGNGGAGFDSFVLQDFAPGDPLVQIADFDPAEDQLVVFYDATLHPDPQLTLSQGSGASVLLLDGVPLASLGNGAALDLSLVQLRAA